MKYAPPQWKRRVPRKRRTTVREISLGVAAGTVGFITSNIAEATLVFTIHAVRASGAYRCTILPAMKGHWLPSMRAAMLHSARTKDKVNWKILKRPKHAVTFSYIGSARFRVRRWHGSRVGVYMSEREVNVNAQSPKYRTPYS